MIDFILRLLVSSTMGVAIYLTFRFLDRKWPKITRSLHTTLCPLLFIAAATLFSYTFGKACLILIFACILGGCSHRRSIDSSYIRIGDVLLMSSASLANIVAGMIIDNFFLIRKFFGFEWIWYCYLLSLMFSPAIFASLLWAKNSMKLQPGADRYFES